MHIQDILESTLFQQTAPLIVLFLIPALVFFASQFLRDTVGLGEGKTAENMSTTQAPDETKLVGDPNLRSPKSEKTVEHSEQKPEEPAVIFATEGQPVYVRKPGRTNSWNFIWDTTQEDGPGSGTVGGEPTKFKPDLRSTINVQHLMQTPVEKSNNPETPVGKALEYREHLLERREREFDRREREIDRRERELDRRERELERRQREFDHDEARSMVDVHHPPHWQEAIDNLRNQLEIDLLAERKKAVERELELEAKVMSKVNGVLEKERQFYGVMRMSDNEVNEMVENSVGYLLQNDEEIADRVRFQSLLYLSQERLASEANLQPPHGSDSLSLAWRLALGPSVVTEDRYKKALELLKDKSLDASTKKLMECKRALEIASEYTSHLRKEGTEMSDHSFSLGRIPRGDYMESVQRQSKQNLVEYEALKALVDFISPEI